MRAARCALIGPWRRAFAAYCLRVSRPYFMKEYQTMLEEHLDDHVTHFERYMRPPEG